MKEIFKNYLDQNQYNKICKYWSFINKFSSKIEDFDYSKYIYTSSLDSSDDEESIRTKIIKHGKIIDYQLEKLKGILKFYQQEYEKYINSIGFELNNRTYDEILFTFLNDGIILNDELFTPEDLSDYFVE